MRLQDRAQPAQRHQALRHQQQGASEPTSTTPSTDPTPGPKGISTFIFKTSWGGFRSASAKGRARRGSHATTWVPAAKHLRSGAPGLPPRPARPGPQPGHRRHPGPRHHPGRLRLRPRLHRRKPRRFSRPVAETGPPVRARRASPCSSRPPAPWSTRPPPKPTATTPTSPFAAAAAKCLASNMAVRVTTDAVQLLAGTATSKSSSSACSRRESITRILRRHESDSSGGNCSVSFGRSGFRRASPVDIVAEFSPTIRLDR